MKIALLCGLVLLAVSCRESPAPSASRELLVSLIAGRAPTPLVPSDPVKCQVYPESALYRVECDQPGNTILDAIAGVVTEDQRSARKLVFVVNPSASTVLPGNLRTRQLWDALTPKP